MSIFRISTITLFAIFAWGLGIESSFAATPSSWTQMISWFKAKPPSKPYWVNGENELPSALQGAAYAHKIDLNQFVRDDSSGVAKYNFELQAPHPDWLQISSDGRYLEGNRLPVTAQASTPIQIKVIVKNLTTKQTGNIQTFIIAVVTPVKEPVLVTEPAPTAPLMTQAEPESSSPHSFEKPAIPSSEKVQPQPPALAAPPSPPPKWSIIEFPMVAVAQMDYPAIHLNEFVSDGLKDDPFSFTLTPGKANPEWIQLQSNGVLTLLPKKISLEDTGTTQIIYLTATSLRTQQSTNAEITIKVIANDNLPAPEWIQTFKLTSAIVGRPYSMNLARGVNLSELADQDKLVFQIINGPTDWLQIANNGYFLMANNIPEKAMGKTYDVTLRVTSKMTGKSSDFNGQIYVNEKPEPLRWKDLPPVSLNQPYKIDLTQYVVSNIKDDHFSFRVSSNTKPSWLSFQNFNFLVGTVTDPKTFLKEQSVVVSVISELSGEINSATLVIPFKPLSQYAPHWQKNILPNVVANDTYKSADLLTKIDKGYAEDDISIHLVNGPNWLKYDDDCRCLVSKSTIDKNLVGKTFTIQLEAVSKISGAHVDYTQLVSVFAGVPSWNKTRLPDIKIAQKEPWEVPISALMSEDSMHDTFNLVVDPFQSPNWIRVIKKENKSYLIIDAENMNVNEINTVQTVRLIAGSQSTGKTSTQLFIMNVKPNPDLPEPTLKQFALPEATVGVTQTVDLMSFIRSSIPKDSIRVLLAPNSPSWLQVKNNQLISAPPVSAMGTPFPINLLIYSHAADKYTRVSTTLNVQLLLVSGDNMESHTFYNNYLSIVIHGLEPNKVYKLSQVRIKHADYGPFYSPTTIKTGEDWENNAFYAVNSDKTIKSGPDGTVSLIYYSRPNNPAPQIDYIAIK